MLLGEPLDVDLVDHRVRLLSARVPVLAPVEGLVDDDGHRHVTRRVEPTRPAPTRRVAVDLRAVAQVAVQGSGGRVDEQLVRVEPKPTGGIVGALDPEPVTLPGGQPRYEAVPHPEVPLREQQPLLGAVLADEAERHRLGRRRDDRDVGALGGEGDVDGQRPTRTDLHQALPRRQWDITNLPRRDIGAAPLPTAVDGRVFTERPAGRG